MAASMMRSSRILDAFGWSANKFADCLDCRGSERQRSQVHSKALGWSNQRDGAAAHLHAEGGRVSRNEDEGFRVRSLCHPFNKYFTCSIGPSCPSTVSHPGSGVVTNPTSALPGLESS